MEDSKYIPWSKRTFLIGNSRAEFITWRLRQPQKGITEGKMKILSLPHMSINWCLAPYHHYKMTLYQLWFDATSDKSNIYIYIYIYKEKEKKSLLSCHY